MKSLNSLLFMVLCLYALNQEQLNNLRYIYSKTKQFDLGLTMSAIAMQESQLGKYKLNINKDSIDVGLFMINTKTLSNSRWNQSRLAERLIKDKDFSISIALERFKYFYNYYRSKGYSSGLSWKRAIMSYNAGWRYNNGTKYYYKIIRNIRLIKGIIK